MKIQEKADELKKANELSKVNVEILKALGEYGVDLLCGILREICSEMITDDCRKNGMLPAHAVWQLSRKIVEATYMQSNCNIIEGNEESVE